MTLEQILSERLTEDKVAEALEANSEKLIAAGVAVDESNLRYIKLNRLEKENAKLKELLRRCASLLKVAIFVNYKAEDEAQELRQKMEEMK